MLNVVVIYQHACLLFLFPALGDNGDCRRSTYGCCRDGATSALGNNYEGCPSECKVGSVYRLQRVNKVHAKITI